MTRPDDFILNTDYLALAQVSNEEFTANFGAESTSGYAEIVHEQDFKVKPVQGAIDRVMISRNGSPFMVGSTTLFAIESGGISTSSLQTIWVYRIDASTIRVRYRIVSNSPVSVPAQTVKVKVSSFNPPNVF